MKKKAEALVKAVDALDAKWNIAGLLSSPEVDEVLRANEELREALADETETAG